MRCKLVLLGMSLCGRCHERVLLCHWRLSKPFYHGAGWWPRGTSVIALTFGSEDLRRDPALTSVHSRVHEKAKQPANKMAMAQPLNGSRYQVCSTVYSSLP